MHNNLPLMQAFMQFNGFPLDGLHYSWIEACPYGETIQALNESKNNEVKIGVNQWWKQHWKVAAPCLIDLEGKLVDLYFLDVEQLQDLCKIAGLMVCYHEVKKVLNGRKLSEIRQLFPADRYQKIMQQAPFYNKGKKSFVDNAIPEKLKVKLTKCPQSALDEYFMVNGAAVLCCTLSGLFLTENGSLKLKSNQGTSMMQRMAWKFPYEYQSQVSASWQAGTDPDNYRWAKQMTTKAYQEWMNVKESKYAA